MYSIYTISPVVVFFIISYSLILLPLIIILKNNTKYQFIQLNQIQSKSNIYSFYLLIFFVLSGLPLTNTFLFKWLCLLNIFNGSNYYLSLSFLIVNLMGILIYYNIFFNRLLVMSFSNPIKRGVRGSLNVYWLNMYIIFSIYFNVFGFLIFNTFIFLI